jgi:hypothetical protein
VNVAIVVVAAACATVLAVKLVRLCRNPRDRTLRALCLMLTGLTISVGIQPFVAGLDRLTGVQKVGGLLGELAVVLAAGAGQVFLIRVYHPDEDARTRSSGSYRVMAATLGVLTVLFVLGPLDPYTARGETHSTTGHLSILPLPYLYLYPYSVYLAGTLIAVARLCVRYARLTELGYLRASLRTLTAGCVAGLCYTLTSLVALTLQETRVNVDDWKTLTTTPLYLATDALLLLGCVIPSLAAARRWLLDERTRRHLHPLWLALYRANPDIAFFPPTSPAHPDLGLRVYRQVIEIRDAQLALRPYFDPKASVISTELAHQAGLADRETAAISEAATLAAALAAKNGGRQPNAVRANQQPPRGGADLAAEIDWLRQVSRAFTNSPIVTRTVHLIAFDGVAADRGRGDE